MLDGNHRNFDLSSPPNCTACHQVQIVPAIDAFPKGPNLTAVAAGQQFELTSRPVALTERLAPIPKRVMTPQTIITDDGRAFSGYLTSEGVDSAAAAAISLLAKSATIPVATIEERVNKVRLPCQRCFTNSVTRKERPQTLAESHNSPVSKDSDVN